MNNCEDELNALKEQIDISEKLFEKVKEWKINYEEKIASLTEKLNPDFDKYPEGQGVINLDEDKGEELLQKFREVLKKKGQDKSTEELYKGSSENFSHEMKDVVRENPQHVTDEQLKRFDAFRPKKNKTQKKQKLEEPEVNNNTEQEEHLKKQPLIGDKDIEYKGTKIIKRTNTQTFNRLIDLINNINRQNPDIKWTSGGQDNHINYVIKELRNYKAKQNEINKLAIKFKEAMNESGKKLEDFGVGIITEDEHMPTNKGGSTRKRHIRKFKKTRKNQI